MHVVILLALADTSQCGRSPLRPRLARNTHPRGAPWHLDVLAFLVLLVPFLILLGDWRWQSQVEELEAMLDPTELIDVTFRATRVAHDFDVTLESECMSYLAAPRAWVLNETTTRRGRRHGRALVWWARAIHRVNTHLQAVCLVNLGKKGSARALISGTTRLRRMRTLKLLEHAGDETRAVRDCGVLAVGASMCRLCSSMHGMTEWRRADHRPPNGTRDVGGVETELCGQTDLLECHRLVVGRIQFRGPLWRQQLHSLSIEVIRQLRRFVARTKGRKRLGNACDDTAGKRAILDKLSGITTLDQGVVDESAQSQLTALLQRWCCRHKSRQIVAGQRLSACNRNGRNGAGEGKIEGKERPSGHLIRDGPHPTVPVLLRMLLVERRNVQRLHRLAHSLKCSFKRWVNNRCCSRHLKCSTFTWWFTRYDCRAEKIERSRDLPIP